MKYLISSANGFKWHNTFKRENPVNRETLVFVSFAEFTQVKAIKITTVENSVNPNWPVSPSTVLSRFTPPLDLSPETKDNDGKSGEKYAIEKSKLFITYCKRKMAVSVLFKFCKYYLYKNANAWDGLCYFIMALPEPSI